MAERVVDEDLADGAAGGEGEEVGDDGGVAVGEGEGGGEFRGRRGGGGGGGEGEVGGEEEVGGCKEGGEEVLRDHHLGAGVGRAVLLRAKDVVLGCIGEAVEEEVDGEEEEAPGAVVGGGGTRGGGFLGRR